MKVSQSKVQAITVPSFEGVEPRGGLYDTKAYHPAAGTKEVQLDRLRWLFRGEPVPKKGCAKQFVQLREDSRARSSAAQEQMPAMPKPKSRLRRHQPHHHCHEHSRQAQSAPQPTARLAVQRSPWPVQCQLKRRRAQAAYIEAHQEPQSVSPAVSTPEKTNNMDPHTGARRLVRRSLHWLVLFAGHRWCHVKTARRGARKLQDIVPPLPTFSGQGSHSPSGHQWSK